MAIIDEEGRLFGAVNVVDALVVLLILAVGLAGVALVTGGGETSGEGETRHATLDFGSQPEHILERLAVGDAASIDGSSGELTISDLHLTTTGQGSHAIARVAVTGQVTDGTFTVGGEALRTGRRVHFETDAYGVNGTVVDVGNRTDLRTGNTTVLLRGTVPPTVARSVETGDEIRVAGRTTATVEDVAVYGVGSGDARTMYVVADLRTLTNGGTARFAGTPLETGRSISLPLAGHRFDGTVERVGGGADRRTDDVLVTSVVEPGVATQIAEGDTYTVSGHPVATVESVAVYGTGDPDRKRVYVGLSVESLGYTETPRIGPDRPLRTGATIPIRTASYELDGEVVRLGAHTLPGEATERTVTLRMDDVPPSRADDVEAGLTETNAGQTVARVVNVDVDPAVVAVTSDDGQIHEREHPFNKDVTITAELQVRETASSVRFKDGPLRAGDDVTLDLGTTTVNATVTDLDDA